MLRAKPVLLVLLALFARGGDAAQLTTNYKRVGKRVEFGGSWLIRETFDDGVDAARAAAWLQDPRRVLAAAWPAEHIRAAAPQATFDAHAHRLLAALVHQLARSVPHLVQLL